MSSIFISLLLSTSLWAGDKINNGGGLWVCPSQNAGMDEIEQAFLIDFYEANQMNLNLSQDLIGSPLEMADRLAQEILVKLPEFAFKWNPILADVKTKIHLVNSELVVIDDALFRMRPLKSLCKSPWEYVQFANYTNMNEVLIRKDLWNLNLIPNLDKAGLVWHEVIYRWMREEYHDTDSLRARRIVGTIFSTLSPLEMQTEIKKTLKSENPPQKTAWVCLIQNQFTFQNYSEHASVEILARSKTLNACQEDNPDLSVHCNEAQMKCDSYRSTSSLFTCSVRYLLDGKNFTETGFSRIDAEAKARISCNRAHPDLAVHCDSQVKCEKVPSIFLNWFDQWSQIAD
jgi:hypothetical protein